MSNTKDVKMYYVESDIEKIQTKTNLYLTSYASDGAFHLTREVILNSIDECIDPDSPGSKIYIMYDIDNDTMTVEDDGRGFPEADYPMDIFCTKIQSGSKFFRTQSGGTSGEFGLGLTAVNALSSSFILDSYREKEKCRHTIIFEDGKKIEDTKGMMLNKDHGCIVKFSPSKRFLGPKTVIPYQDVVTWVEKMSYFIPKGIEIKIEILKGFKIKEKYKFKAQPFISLLDTICPDKNYSPKCEFSGESEIEENVKMLGKNSKVVEKTLKKSIHLDVALRYSPESITMYDSYCNFTNTTEGGVHQNAVENCFCRYMLSKARATQTDAQKEKYPIKWEDIKMGLCVIINLTTGAQVGFVGNAKQKIGNEELTPYLVEIINTNMDKFFTDNPKVLDEYIKIIKLNTKARVEMQKVKNATQRERMNSFKEYEIKNYIRCNNTGKKFKELFLTEGDSAGGGASNGSDKDTQAFLLFRGVVANPLKCSLSEIMENDEWRTFVTILRCGIGKNFDINKLYFDRINIFTDSDSDGYGISSGMIVFIYTYLRPLIEAGKVYKVFSPLYRIDDKEHPFVVNKSEMVELFQKKVAKHYKVQRVDNAYKFNKDDMIEFLQDTYDYSSNLIRISNNLGHVNKFLVERIIALLTVSGIIHSTDSKQDTDMINDGLKSILNNQKFIKEFMSLIQEKYPEVKLNSKTQTLSGVVDGHFCSIKINHRFIKQSEDIIPVIEKYNYLLNVQEKGKDENTIMTIGEFLDQTVKLSSKILTRYKGLGELNPDQMFKTALDINNRVSIQYTVDDAEREVEIFKKLHGSAKNDLKRRKEMMANYKINRDDLDN